MNDFIGKVLKNMFFSVFSLKMRQCSFNLWLPDYKGGKGEGVLNHVSQEKIWLGYFTFHVNTNAIFTFHRNKNDAFSPKR